MAVSNSISGYPTVEEIATAGGFLGKVPDPSGVGVNRTPEQIGTGDNVKTTFFTSHAYVIADTYTFYYGSDANSLTELTETTHYIYDINLGKLVLTAAGVTLVGTDNIYSEYKYSLINLSSDEIYDYVVKAKAYFTKETFRNFVDTTVPTPSYEKQYDELQWGKGGFDGYYFSDKQVIGDFQAIVSGDYTSTDTSITVDSTDGFPASGTVGVGINKLTYTSKTDTTFEGVSGIDEDISDGDVIKPYVMEISYTEQGTKPTYFVLREGTDYSFDKTSGRFYLYSYDDRSFRRYDPYIVNAPLKDVPDRVRISYLWGEGPIPEDVVQCIEMITISNLLHRMVRAAHLSGRNTFEPSMINVDRKAIQRIIDMYKNIGIKSV